MQVITLTITGLAMGIYINRSKARSSEKDTGTSIGSGISFAVIAIILTVVFVTFAPSVASFMNAPAEAFDGTSTYIRICCCWCCFYSCLQFNWWYFLEDLRCKNSTYDCFYRLCCKYFR